MVGNGDIRYSSAFSNNFDFDEITITIMDETNGAEDVLVIITDNQYSFANGMMTEKNMKSSERTRLNTK